MTTNYLFELVYFHLYSLIEVPLIVKKESEFAKYSDFFLSHIKLELPPNNSTSPSKPTTKSR